MDLKSHCPIHFALEHFGDKWSLLVIRDLMFKGKRHYNQFLEGGENVSTSVLGDRLKNLETQGIITRGEDHVKKSRIRYSLTSKGIDLLPLLLEMILWSAVHDRQTAADKGFLEEANKNRQQFLAKLTIDLKREHLV